MDNIIYVVVPGDTLWKLSKRFNTDVHTIASYNGIADPDVLQVGQVLRIPKENSCGKVNIHIVKSGDTLFKIAKEYGTTVEKLAEINGISDPDMIEPETVLRLPMEGCEKKPSVTCTVKSGDTLYSIAKKYGTTVKDLMNLNKIYDPGCIYPGRVLIVKM